MSFLRSGLAALACLLTAAVSTATAQEAETIFVNGQIFTMDAYNPRATAVAIRDRRLVIVGSDEDALALRGPATEVIDLDGAFVMPGIIDPHMHPFEDFHRDTYLLGIEDNSTPEAILAAVKAYADANPEKEWIIGGAWPPGMFQDENPKRELLDEVISDRPVFLQDQSAHSVWMNSKALELSGIMAAKDAELPDGAVVERDEAGVPSGTIREHAIGFARRSMPPFPQEEMLGTARGFQELFHGLGITSAKAAAGYPAHVDAIHNLHEAGEWKFRMLMAMSYNYYDAGSTLEEQIGAIKEADGKVLDFFDPRGFKIFLDGTPPTREGWVLDPYPGTDSHGTQYYSAADLVALFALSTEMERTVMAHATGDRSVREVLNAIEATRDAFPDTQIRHHSTHNGMVHRDDITRFRELGLTIELSPIVWFPAATVAGFEKVMGKEAVSAYTNPRRLLDAGADIALGSDWSVGPLDPWARIGFVVSRVRPDDPESGPYLPDAAITPEEAIRASTLGPAHVLGIEEETGSIAVGKYADLIVLDRDITAIPATSIKDTRVLRTVFAGETVHLAASSSVSVIPRIRIQRAACTHTGAIHIDLAAQRDLFPLYDERFAQILRRHKGRLVLHTDIPEHYPKKPQAGSGDSMVRGPGKAPRRVSVATLPLRP